MKSLICHCTIGIALFFCLLVTGTADAHEDHGPEGKITFTKHFEETLFDITGRGAYSVEVLLDEKEYKIGKNVIGLVVHDAHDSDVQGAELVIALKNLATGEAAPGRSVVTDRGEGLYAVSGLDLHRDGRWELEITVRKGGLEDLVKFVLPDALKARRPKGRYSP